MRAARVPSGIVDQPSTLLPEGTVSLLFTDVEGSTDLRTREGDDVAQEFLSTHEGILRDVAAAHGGTEAAFMGDGFLFAFASTRRALGCAVAIQEALEAHNAAGSAHPIRVRIGINTGEVTERGGTLYGTAVNAAARIMARADGGQIYVSQLVKDLTAGVREFRFADRGMHPLKGFPEEWRLYEVLWRGEAEEPAAAEPVERPAAPPLAAEAIEGARPRPAFELVGRDAERAILDEELVRATATRIRVVSLEGEAGIGKTRLMEEAAQLAQERGFGVVAVGADEELRGPFLLLRTLLATTEIEALAVEAGAAEALAAARAELGGGAGATQEGLTASEQMLHVYDVATVALRQIAAARPLLLLLDDLQWADEDSVKLVRYLVRTSQTMPVVIVLSIRWEVEPTRTAASTLVADLERMHLARRLRLDRLTRPETGELLEQVLGAPVGPDSVATLHARGEGVPFFVVEFARAYREARLLQLVKGRWEISRTGRQTVPTSVQILIERRVGQLPDDSRAALSDAAVVGRRIRVAELADVCTRTGEARSPEEMAELLEPAVRHSLLAPTGQGNDYVFTHDQIRSALVAMLPKDRRRAIHRALVAQVAEREGVDLDAEALEAPPGTLSTLAHHALAAGDAELGVRASLAAARAALGAHAPEEAVRLVEAARAAASRPDERAELLRVRDDALTVLERPSERLPVLAELAALASALGDPGVSLDVTLRRSSAARQTGEHEQAIALAREARGSAAEQGDPRAELRASLELGQAALHTPVGESFMPVPGEVDLDGAEEAFSRAAELAQALDDERTFAIARRELGVVENGRAHARMLILISEGRQDEAPQDDELRGHLEAAKGLIGEAVAVCERTGDRRCEMSSLIALAYSHVLDDTQHGHAGRIEQIRRLMQRLSRMTSETERARSELHMLYSILVYALAHAHPELALARGMEAYGAARAQGDHLFEFLAAGGLAEVHVQLGDTAEAESWLGQAEEAALASPSPMSLRQLEEWRGLLRAAQGDAAAMQEHFREAARLAAEQGSVASRCEANAQLALKASLLAEGPDDAILEAAEEAADEALRIAEGLPGAAPWAAKAHAGRALAAHQRGDRERAVAGARAALAAEHEGRHLFKVIDVNLWLAVATVLEGESDPQAQAFRGETSFLLLMALQWIADPAIRERWRSAPSQSRLIELLGGLPDPPAHPGAEDARPILSPEEADLLRRFTAGQSAEEIAEAVGLELDRADAILAEVFEKLGAAGAGDAAERAVRVGIA